MIRSKSLVSGSDHINLKLIMCRQVRDQQMVIWLVDDQRRAVKDLFYETIIVIILSILSQLNGLNLSHKILTSVSNRPMSGKLTGIDNRKLNSRNRFISHMHRSSTRKRVPKMGTPGEKWFIGQSGESML